MSRPRRISTTAVTLALTLATAGCESLAPQKPAANTPPSPAATVPAPAAPAATVAPATHLATAPTADITAPAEPAAATKEQRTQPEDIERLLAYFERLRRLPAAELAKEHEAARLAHGRAATDATRVSYAMALSLPGTAFNDDARALELLNPLVRRNDGGLRALAVLLTTFIQERRRLGGDLAAVQQKLDALKSLERKLIDREQNNPGRKP